MVNHLSLSIVIITYNGATLVDRLMSSLMILLDNNNDIEVVIVDNSSTDSTTDILNKWHQKLGNQLKIICAERNLGVAGGRSLGVSHATGKLILFLDNDTIVTQEAILQLTSYIESHPNCGVVAPALRSPQGELQESAKPFPGIVAKLRNILCGNKQNIVNDGNEDVLHPYYVIGACQLFRRSTYDQIGGLDTRIFYGPEDADFCERIRQTGLTVDYLQNVTIIHEWQRATRRKLFSKLSFKHLQGLILFYIKHRRCI